MDTGTSETVAARTWRQTLEAVLPLYGHRNWIVVADSAYPWQSRPGIETVSTTDTQQSVVTEVLNMIRQTPHVRPIVHLDRELAFVDEHDAPGIAIYRDWLATQLEDSAPRYSPHEAIIARLDEAAKTFRVTIIKTSMTIPYTTVFFELDCAYWTAEAESRLRSAMPPA